jgi:hypothetical protein
MDMEKRVKALTGAMKGWERPCGTCEYHKEKGCTQWDCVIEKARIEAALASVSEEEDAEAVFNEGRYYDYGTEDAFGGVFGISFGYVEIVGREGNEISFRVDGDAQIQRAAVSIGIHRSEMFYPFGRKPDVEGKIYKVAADHQRLWNSHSERFARVSA